MAFFLGVMWRGVQEENTRQRIDRSVSDSEITYDISNSIYIHEPQVVANGKSIGHEW